MTNDSASALDALLRRLVSDDEFERQAALGELALRPIDVLAGLVRHPIVAVRVALAKVLAGHTSERALALVAQLADDDDSAVRQTLAEGLKALASWPVPDEVLLRLANDSDSDVADVAVPALAHRPRLHGALVELLRKEDQFWSVRKITARTHSGSCGSPGPTSSWR